MFAISNQNYAVQTILHKKILYNFFLSYKNISKTIFWTFEFFQIIAILLPSSFRDREKLEVLILLQNIFLFTWWALYQIHT